MSPRIMQLICQEHWHRAPSAIEGGLRPSSGPHFIRPRQVMDISPVARDSAGGGSADDI